MKKIISLALILVLALSIAVPALAHVMDPNLPGSYGPGPMQYGAPAPNVVCPACMCPMASVIMGIFRPCLPPPEFNTPCPFMPGCIIHTHQYRVDYQCPACMLIFSVDLQYDWHSICKGINKWIINVIYPGPMVP
jgi:hypothetical protein